MGFLVAVVVFIVLILLGLGLDFGDFSLDVGRWAFILDLPSLAFVLIPAIAFAAAAGAHGSSLLEALRGAIAPWSPRGKASQAAETLRFFGDACAVLGVLGSLIGSVLALQNLSEPTDLGPALAVALVAYFYGIVIRLLCRVGARRIESAGVRSGGEA
jgi:hypothetical protein